LVYKMGGDAIVLREIFGDRFTFHPFTWKSL